MSYEIWKPILGFENLYEVSNNGKIRSFSYRWFNGKPRLLSLQVNCRHKYIQVCLRKNGKKYMPRVHRLILEAFVGKCPAGQEGSHDDGNRQNNNLSNLSWKTHKENIQDKIIHGTMNNGIKQHCAKLNPKKVIKIRELYASGAFTKTGLGKMFGVGRTAIDNVVKEITWRGYA